ncbi:MAG TPA: hypothetical protein VHB47_09485 [Thermoanaerobaculia bacterium]|nr:hypothetical protein [Thermoanaerobaculia bacterium]
MRKQLNVILGLGLAAVFPASATTHLKLQCVARDLTPGAHVWVEVRPQYHQAAMVQDGMESGALEEAKGESVWQFDVPASGRVAPITHDFTFAVDLDRTGTDPVGFITFKTRFKIEHPTGQDKVGYGEVYEATLAMLVMPGASPLSRCLRLREVGGKMIVETAADCLDSSFGKSPKHLRLPHR